MRVLIGVINAKLKMRLSRDLAGANIDFIVLEHPRDLLQAECGINELAIVETDNDVAELVQIVNDMNRKNQNSDLPPAVIALASRQALEDNPSLEFWLIDGHAAVECCWATEDYIGGQFISFIKRFEVN